MGHSNSEILVSTKWLAENLSQPTLHVLDGSWYMPADKRDVQAEFLACHIPGAHFFDIDAISDQETDLPHMIPPVAQFEKQVADLGLSNHNQIVVYDSIGLFSAARVWWLLRYFGLTNIAVLDGGLPKWQAEGHPTTSGANNPTTGTLNAAPHANLLRTAAQVLDASQNASAQIVDARAPARFKGEVPEPRAGLRSGHMPNAKNVFFKSLLNPDGTLKSDAELAAIFNAQGIDLTKPAITSCGSGVTASILSLALQKIGHNNHALYDGSWSEWGALHDYPVEQG